MSGDRASAAERQRRARARRRAAELVVPVVVDVDLGEHLIALGLLLGTDAENREEIGRALGDLLHRHLATVTRDGG